MYASLGAMFPWREYAAGVNRSQLTRSSPLVCQQRLEAGRNLERRDNTPRDLVEAVDVDFEHISGPRPGTNEFWVLLSEA
jgi:hypothetical protein